MRRNSRPDRIRALRITLLAAGMLALAGCVSGYSLVQPGATGAGAYYTGDEPYPAPGYYYDDGIGAYDPYGVDFDDGSLYGPSFAFGLGFGNICGWGCAGYYGGWPWYYGGYLDGRHHHRHRHHGDPVATAPLLRPWLNPDHARVPTRHLARGATPLIALPEQPMEGFAHREALESASFAPRGTYRMPRPIAPSSQRAYMAPDPPAFDDRPLPAQPSASRGFSRPTAPAVGPMHPAPSPTHSNQASSVKIR